MMKRTSDPVCVTLIFCFLILFALADVVSSDFDDHISVSCGAASSSKIVNGREWLGDVYPNLELKGASSRTSVTRRQATSVSVDPVPYETARISHSQFSYNFRLHPGLKYIRLHFYPTSYKFNSGFERLGDFFSVEAGSFTLLSNFSASITAHDLGVSTFSKEYCINVENEPFSLVFSPVSSNNPSQAFYAFINGIEIISVPSSLSYCHDEEFDVQVVGKKYVVVIDSATALELVHRFNRKKDSVPLGTDDDIHGKFGIGSGIVKERGDKVKDNTWKISVDVGFRYLVRLHFCKIGVIMAEAEHKDFIILINHTIVASNTDMLQQGDKKAIVWFKNYMFMVNGNKKEGKRDILISTCSKEEFVDDHVPLEGYEIFKLSNNDNNLASPNSLPPLVDSRSQTSQNWLPNFGLTNTIVTIFVTLVCLVNIFVHKLRQSWDVNSTQENYMPSIRAKRLCRRFSLTEILSATDNFFDGFFIGKGGFGKVYKGQIDNGQQTVAIKRLKSKSSQGKNEFETEIELLSDLRHVNLVSLLGYCCEQREMILVYELMPCGTLADHLYILSRKNEISPSLSWKQRLNICIGASQGIDYLHIGCGIIHRDIKSSNILLDGNFVAKVSDFGLAKIQIGQTHVSTNFKGTFGYFDPDYFKTQRLTMKSDTYSFGVVLLEVLCGRPAVDKLAEEDERSLTMWALEKISNGEVEQIVDPNLRGEILPSSLKVFLKVVKRCLRDEPKKRPTMGLVRTKLELALELQENVNYLDPNEDSLADDLSVREINQPENVKLLVSTVVSAQPENMNSLLIHEINDGDPMPYTDKALLEKAKSLFPTEIALAADALSARNNSAVLHRGTRQIAKTTSELQNVTSSRLQYNLQRTNAGQKRGIRSTMLKLSRFLPWDAFRRSTKQSEKRNRVNIVSGTDAFQTSAMSAPMSRRTGNVILHHPALKVNGNRGNNDQLFSSNLRKFSFAELKAATRNFRPNSIVGEGGFGSVYKGWLEENGIEYVVAVKRLNPEGQQGFEEWLAEITFLGKLSHPNLVKLFGYCLEDRALLLVYEFIERGSLDNHLFRKSAKPLPWDVRINILIGAARGLAFLHEAEKQVIVRDFKPSNILLDESYNAKLSDFGLGKWGPDNLRTHVSTRVMGTMGYAAPEYIATGHLTVRSDVYGFGTVLLEMLTGLRTLDAGRQLGQRNLVDHLKPALSSMRKLKNHIDPRLEGNYPTKCAFHVAQLARRCLEVNPKTRPSSREIVEILERINT